MKLNINFDQWIILKDINDNIKLFIEDKEDKYALYLNDEQYYNIFVPYLKKNNINNLYWRSGMNAIDYKPSGKIIIYKFQYDNYNLSYSSLKKFSEISKNKITLLKL